MSSGSFHQGISVIIPQGANGYVGQYVLRTLSWTNMPPDDDTNIPNKSSILRSQLNQGHDTEAILLVPKQENNFPAGRIKRVLHIILSRHRPGV
jgi:hypothetical protein